MYVCMHACMHACMHVCMYIYWDVTNLSQTIHRSGAAAAEAAAERKNRKYASIAMNHTFLPVAFETLGQICSDRVNLIALIGEKLTSKSGDGRERRILFQGLSVAIQRGNAAAFHGTFKAVDSWQTMGGKLWDSLCWYIIFTSLIESDCNTFIFIIFDWPSECRCHTSEDSYRKSVSHQSINQYIYIKPER